MVRAKRDAFVPSPGEFLPQENNVPISSPDGVVNRLIGDLPPAVLKRFREQCTTEQLLIGEILCDIDTPMEYVHFPLTGYVYLAGAVKGRRPLAVSMIGNEGMLGATLALGVDTSPLRGVVQGTGTALRMTAVQFRRQLEGSPELRRTVDGFLYVLIEQLAQAAACNSFHEVIERLARWLLMTHDRAQGDSFRLTHAFLAEMLGVRRSAVTIAAGELQQRRVIRYTRGHIKVISRRGLEAASCGCYAAALKAYDRRLPVTAIRGQPSRQQPAHLSRISFLTD